MTSSTHTDTTDNAIRYLLMTVVSVPTNVTLYLLLIDRVGFPAELASVVAALTIAGPRYLANKHLVWAKRRVTRNKMAIAVHLSLTAGGLALSGAVAAVLSRSGASPATLALGNVAAFATTWVARFLIFNYAIFTGGSADEPGQE